MIEQSIGVIVSGFVALGIAQIVGFIWLANTLVHGRGLIQRREEEERYPRTLGEIPRSR